MTSTRPIDALKRFWWVVVAFTIFGALVGGLPTPATSADITTSTRWTASHTLLVAGTSDSLTFNQLQLFATTGQVPARAAAKLGYSGAPAALASEIVVVADQLSAALRISTTQDTGDRAVAVADAFADELTAYLAERQDELREDRLTATLDRLVTLESQVEDAQDTLRVNDTDAIAQAQLDARTRQYSVVFEQYDQLQIESSQLVLTSLERAQPVPVTEQGGGLSAPRSRTTRGLMGAVAGAALGCGLAVVLARSDRRIRSREQVEELLGISAHVNIPAVSKHHAGDLAVVPGRHDPLSDSYRTLRSILTFIEATNPRAIDRASITLVVSPGPGDGKTSVSANLASALVEAGNGVVAINTDFRRPTLSGRLTVPKPEPVGLTLGEIEHAPLELLLAPVDDLNLAVFDLAGLRGHNPGDLARVTARVLPRIAAVADQVVIDSSPLGATAEVLEFVPLADTIVIVITLGHTTISSARRSIEMLRALSTANLLLVIIGGESNDSSYYYYAMVEPERPQRWFGRRKEKSADDTGEVPIITRDVIDTEDHRRDDTDDQDDRDDDAYTDSTYTDSQ